MKQPARIFFLFCCILSGGFIFHESTTIGFGFLSLYLSIVFLVSSIFSVTIPSKMKFKYIHKSLSSFFIWLISMTTIIGSLFIVNKINNISPILFSTEFYWEEGLNVEFRKNGTFRALNYHIMGGNVTYGRYKLQDSLIVLLDKMKFGKSNLNDTLIATEKGVFFTMENEWRVNEGTMSYVYGHTAKFLITNNSKHKIDSIFINLSYTKQENTFKLIEPNESIEYMFKMENPYVDGSYILSYRVIDKTRELKKIENLTNGFPIETVREIHFHDDSVTIETIFGNKQIRKI